MSSHETTLEFEYESPARATLIAESVAREIGEIDDARSQTTIEQTDSVVSISLVAADVIALRAALNTWLTLIDVAEQAAKVGETACHSQ